MSDNPYEAPIAQSMNVDATVEMELASRWTRLAAAILDGIFMMVIMLPIMFLTGYIQSAAEAGLVDTIVYGLLGMAIFLLLNGYSLHKNGQTLGKKICGIKIVSYKTNELLPLVKLILLRNFIVGAASNIPLIGPLFNLVNVCFIFGGERRCIHDLIAGTKVVNA